MRRFTLWILPAFAALAFACVSSSDDQTPAAAKQREVIEKRPAGQFIGDKAVAEPTPTNAAGQIEVEANAKGFSPSRIHVEAGKPVKLLVTRTVEKTCMDGIVIPSLEIEEALAVGEPVEVEFTPEEAGTIAFQCPMGHGKSSILVLPKKS